MLDGGYGVVVHVSRDLCSYEMEEEAVWRVYGISTECFWKTGRVLKDRRCVEVDVLNPLILPHIG